MIHGTRIPVLAAAALAALALAMVPAPPSPQAVSQMLAAADAAERRFLAVWETAWKASQAEQHEMVLCGAGCRERARVANLHCHADYTMLPPTTVDPRTMLAARNPMFIEPERHIPSDNSAFAVCPSWSLNATYARGDERIAIDNAIGDAHVPRVRAARDSLIGVLSRTARAVPSSERVLGQLVRYLVDQREHQRALSEAERCATSAWWCSVLVGYVHGRTYQFARADAAFARALATMPESLRCAWTDLAALLDDDARHAYRNLSCAARDSANTVLWWLADPLYILEGNERRVEHFLRRTRLALLLSSGRDGRFDWRPELGNDARAKMLERFGWPAYVYWAGFQEDSDHTAWLAGRPRNDPPNEPYTTFEYGHGRAHTFPSARAIANPLAASANDWELTARERQASRSWPERSWWPREHFTMDVPITQLAEPQTVMFRRADSVLLAVSVNLDPEVLGRRAGETVGGVTLVTTEEPGSLALRARRSGVTSSAVAMSAMIPSRPTLIGIELPPATAARGAARTRFAVTPPAPLTALRTGERAISTPAILSAGSDGEALPTSTDSALNTMSGDLRVKPVGRIGVYWETYGFALSDTVEFAIWIERFTPQGIARRFATSLRIAQDLNTPVATVWREEPGSARVHTVRDRLPIHGRSISLDVSRLRSGSYWLDVAARVPGRDVVRARTAIVVE